MRLLSIAIYTLLSLGTIACHGCGQRDNPKSSTPPTHDSHSVKTFPPITTTYRPANADPQQMLPILVTLHGMSSLPKDFLGDDLQEYANAMNVIIIAVSAPLPQNDKEYDWSDDVKVNNARIQSALDEQLTSIPHRRSRVFLLGYSQGAFAALNLGLAFPDQYSGVIAISPGSMTNPQPLEPRLSFRKHGFILCYGGNDRASWVKQGRDRIAIADQRGAITDTKVYPQEGHTIPGDLHEQLPKWFDLLLQLSDEKIDKFEKK